MSLFKILEFLNISISDGAFWLLFILTIIDISPIKINPWKHLIAWMGSIANKEINEKIDAIGDRLDAHIKSNAETNARDYRNIILIFAHECQLGVIHTQEQYEYILTLCDEYDNYVKSYNLTNGVIESSVKFIKDDYAKRIKTDNFLSNTMPKQKKKTIK